MKKENPLTSEQTRFCDALRKSLKCDVPFNDTELFAIAVISAAMVQNASAMHFKTVEESNGV